MDSSISFTRSDGAAFEAVWLSVGFEFMLHASRKVPMVADPDSSSLAPRGAAAAATLVAVMFLAAVLCSGFLTATAKGACVFLGCFPFLIVVFRSSFVFAG